MVRELKALLVLVVVGLAAAPVASGATFTRVPTPIVTASTTGDVIDMFGSTVKCTKTTFRGTFPENASALTLSPTYANCTAFGGLPATVTAPKDALTFTADGTLHINGTINVHVFNSAEHTMIFCHAAILAQTAAGKVTYANNENGTITVTGSVGTLTTTQARTSAFCPAGTHTTSATYKIQAEGMVLKEELERFSFHVK